MKITRIGLDLAKRVFVVHGVDERERACVRKKLRRDEVRAFFAKLPPCVVAMEACSSSHYWARELQKLGPVKASRRSDCWRSRAWGRLRPQRWWRTSERASSSRMGGSLPPGWAWLPSSIPVAVRPGWDASPERAIGICARC